MPHETYSEANVLSSSGGSKSLVAWASVGESGAFSLAAWRTGFESLELPGFGHVATLAAMSGVIPVCASPSLLSAQRGSTSPARESVRFAGVFLPAPQPPSAALPSAEQSNLPLAAAPSAAVTFTRRFAVTRQRWRKSERTPNHALQRTGAAVTAPASAAAFPPARQGPRQPRPSLSLGSLGVSSRTVK